MPKIIGLVAVLVFTYISLQSMHQCVMRITKSDYSVVIWFVILHSLISGGLIVGLMLMLFGN